MTKRLKCVGGPSDGRWRSIDQHRDDCEIVDQYLPQFDMFSNCIPPDRVIVTYTHYTLRRICDSQGIIVEFLADAKMSDSEAIRYQFGK